MRGAGSFGGYHQRELPAPDPELTQVGPGTPCGEYLRRFWQPVAFAREIRETPLRARILGEDLVVFRDRSGRPGVLHLHCAHRGTSLEYGIPQPRGIRCCYHGWVYDVDGRCLETPGEPPGSRLRERVWQGAYPTHELGGLVFAYLGPPERRPAFPVYDSFDIPGHTLMPAARFTLPCNWLQVKDNSMDPVHTAFLHALSSGYQFTEAFGVVPELDWRTTESGMVYLATRRVRDLVWVRVCDFIPPNVHQFTREIEEAAAPKTASRPIIIRWAVPDDDTHTTNFELAQVDPAWGLTPEDVARPGFGQSDDRPYAERQRHPADFDAQASQRTVAIHALEHLGAADRGVIMLRRILRDGIRATARGEDPRGTHWRDGEVIRTFTQDAVLAVLPAPTPEADRQLLRATALGVIGHPEAASVPSPPPSA
ncbi:MAG: Rieske 2Fe-2S domain-containing protein [Candidatus Rokubacteria bacterium]|nr:Rieske 2Fe-2S domain-containing protein [Candidatus Rokubacteria bacterium]